MMNSNEDFQDIYLKYQRFSAGVAYRIVKDRVLAEDICHDMFYSLYQTGVRLDTANERKLRSLILYATINKTRDYFRKRSTKLEKVPLDRIAEEECADDRYNPEAVVLRMEKRKYQKMVFEKLRRRNPVNYDIFVKTMYMGIPPAIVAEEYGISRNSVNNRNLRTKAWLLKELNKLYGEHEP